MAFKYGVNNLRDTIKFSDGHYHNTLQYTDEKGVLTFPAAYSNDTWEVAGKLKNNAQALVENKYYDNSLENALLPGYSPRFNCINGIALGKTNPTHGEISYYKLFFTDKFLCLQEVWTDGYEIDIGKYPWDSAGKIIDNVYYATDYFGPSKAKPHRIIISLQGAGGGGASTNAGSDGAGGCSGSTGFFVLNLDLLDSSEKYFILTPGKGGEGGHYSSSSEKTLLGATGTASKITASWDTDLWVQAGGGDGGGYFDTADNNVHTCFNWYSYGGKVQISLKATQLIKNWNESNPNTFFVWPLCFTCNDKFYDDAKKIKDTANNKLADLTFQISGKKGGEGDFVGDKEENSIGEAQPAVVWYATNFEDEINYFNTNYKNDKYYQYPACYETAEHRAGYSRDKAAGSGAGSCFGSGGDGGFNGGNAGAGNCPGVSGGWGSGGGGARWLLFNYPKGGNGGNGFIKLYY